MGFSPSAVDAWEDARVFDAWNILIGERMAKSCGTIPELYRWGLNMGRRGPM